MHRTIHRLAAAAALSLLLAAAVGAGSAVAAPAPGTAPGGVQALTAASGRCAAEWEAARTGPTVEELQALGFCEIDRRLEDLARMQTAVDGSQTLTDAHEASLDAILASTTTGLQALRAEIDAATTLDGAREGVRRIVEDFRVYVLVARQVRLVIADDVVAAGVERVEAAADRLEDAIEAAREAGRNVGDAPSHLAAMRREANAAARAVEGDAAEVLALTPAAWNAGDAKPVLDAARASVQEARESLRTAIREARAGFRDVR
jgi:hypothetical protein